MSMSLRVETTKIETTLRLAQMLDGHNGLSMEERQQTLQDAQAEGISTFDSLRARILLGITGGNAQLVGMLRELEFGDFSDNYAAFRVSLHRVEHGEVERGLVGLYLLREHIIQCAEVQSFRHLLPMIDKAFANVKAGLLKPTGGVTEQPGVKLSISQITSHSSCNLKIPRPHKYT